MLQSDSTNLESRLPTLDKRQPHPPSSDTINLLDYLEVVVKHRCMIIVTTLIGFVISIAVSLVLPKSYIATAKILPPQQDQNLMSMMMGQMGGGAASFAGELLGKGSPADLYVGILNSETISDAIIDRFKLMEVYKNKYRADAYNALGNSSEIVAGKKDGIISITVQNKDPKWAADIANAYVEELGKLTVRLNITGAGQNSTFLGERLAKAKIALAAAEDNLKNFQSRNKALDISEQAKGTIQGIADLEGQLSVEEVKLASIKRVYTDSSQEVKNQQAVVANIRGQISKFDGKRPLGAIPGFGSLPEIGQQHLRLMREFKIQETLVELLTKQYEMSKLSEEKDVSSIQILQKARVPDKKVKPKRTLIVLSSTFMTLCMAMLYAFVREYISRIPEQERLRLNQILSMLTRRLAKG